MNNKIGTVAILVILISILASIEIATVNAANLITDTDIVDNLVEITDTGIKETLKSIDFTQFNLEFNMTTFTKWSPDGSELLVGTRVFFTTKNASAEDKRILARCVPGPFGPSELVSTIFRINADGSEITNIASAEGSIRTARNNTYAFIEDAWWDSDGDKIVYQVRNYCDEAGYKFYVSDTKGSILAETKGPDTPFMQWRKDGNKVAIVDQGGSSQIYVIDVENSTVSQLSLGVRSAPYGIKWSPEGNKIAFIGYKNGEIYTANANTSSVQQLTTTVTARELSWKPDGKKLVFTAENDGLYVINADDRSLSLIEKGNFMLISWSPDGKKLLFGGAGKTYALDIDGMTTKSIVTASFVNGGWNPNGDRIAFRSDVYSSIYTVNSDGTDKVTLPESYSMNPENYFGWGLDNRLYYLTNDSLVRVNTNGTERLSLVKNISTDISSHNKIYLSPDNSRILFRFFDLNDEREHIYILKMKGYDETMSIHTPSSIKQGTEASIEVKSMSKPVENAAIFLNGREIGKTDDTGFLKYSFKEAGNYKLSAVKQGFRNANKSITIQEQSPESAVITTTIPAGTYKAPGFSLIFGLISLVLTIYQIKKMRRIK